MTDTLLKVDNLTKHFSLKSFFSLFGDDSDVVKAVDGISFGIKRGETYGVVGESGSGKSTTARLITRLIDPTSGTIEFDGQNISDLPINDFHKIRPRIQMVFQDPYTSLNPRMRVSQALGNPLKLHEIVPDDAIEERVIELLELVGLQADHRHRYPHEFSGGQRQRISIARAMALEPDLIIADEAVSALDVSVRAQILNLFRRLQKTQNLTYLFIAHDLSVVEHFCDRVGVMHRGKIVEEESVENFFSDTMVNLKRRQIILLSYSRRIAAGSCCLGHGSYNNRISVNNTISVIFGCNR
jgi:peptide/nickel transport system ATP-binding protein